MISFEGPRISSKNAFFPFNYGDLFVQLCHNNFTFHNQSIHAMRATGMNWQRAHHSGRNVIVENILNTKHTHTHIQFEWIFALNAFLFARALARCVASIQFIDAMRFRAEITQLIINKSSSNYNNLYAIFEANASHFIHDCFFGCLSNKNIIIAYVVAHWCDIVHTCHLSLSCRQLT